MSDRKIARELTIFLGLNLVSVGPVPVAWSRGTPPVIEEPEPLAACRRGWYPPPPCPEEDWWTPPNSDTSGPFGSQMGANSMAKKAKAKWVKQTYAVVLLAIAANLLLDAFGSS